ncbi:MAG TPA: hypothetical protein GX702_06340 [Chloroflexi bacterium]|jgi:hypothetical protein|nr:hypothetical protein [Chloroflexota bacterium]
MAFDPDPVTRPSRPIATVAVWGLIGVLGLVLLFAYQKWSEEDLMTDRERAQVALPALDVAVPPVIETATFAMG